MIPHILTVGHACLDIIHMVPKIPKPNTKIATTDLNITIGGNAANAAAALCDLGAKADLCTVFGTDGHPFTRILLALLRARNVGTDDCRYQDNTASSSSTIMVTPDGERAIMNWKADSIRDAISVPQDISKYAMVMADTYRLPMVNQVFAMTRERNIPTMLDVDIPFKDINEIPNADHVWFSQEAWATHRMSLEELQGKFGGIVGITDGYRPVVWLDHNGQKHYMTPPRVDAKNTLGAGDVFRARLALGICLKEDLIYSVERACYAACDHITNNELTKII